MSEGDTASMKPYPIEGSHLSKINQLKAIISELRDSRSSAYGVIDLLRDKLHHTSGQLAESIAKVKELKQGNERWDRLETKFEELTGQIREESVEALVGAEAKVATAVEVLRGTQMTLKKKEEELVDALDKNSRLQYQLGSTKQTALQLVEKNHGISKMLSEREEETIALKLELKLMKENAEKIQLSCGEDLQVRPWPSCVASISYTCKNSPPNGKILLQ
ncbi:hypothetical protein BD779DRAFT_1241760 [Infundibulicybe gibba]|nr:hypothetical protein BD779DRAFT_1241760 [Infundibulicybe gibba]